MKFWIMAILLFLTGCTVKNSQPSTARHSEETENAGRASNVIQQEEAPAAEAQPEPSSAEADSVLAAVSTPLLDNSAARVENINLACGAVNGIAVYPGGTFSFNDTVGRRTEERGYQDAPVIINGHSEQGCGGGVCQVSTTLYMAAETAGLSIVERHPHSHSVPYAPEGMDATVISGEKDLRFTNNTDNVLILYVWTDGEEVFSKITKNNP